jgi:hypothetical protein
MPAVHGALKIAVFGLAVCAALAAGRAGAIDDRFDPTKYEKGGFAPATDPGYAKECGSCHFAYLPGMLPARSWRAVIAGAQDHFGESLSLPADVSGRIERYLTENAADRSPYRGSELMLERLAEDAAPTRITALPLMRQRHVVVRQLLPQSPVKTLTNCDACHERAATGSFAYNEIVVPGVTKIVRPGGLF